jgi:hypothetical protein
VGAVDDAGDFGAKIFAPALTNEVASLCPATEIDNGHRIATVAAPDVLQHGLLCVRRYNAPGALRRRREFMHFHFLNYTSGCTVCAVAHRRLSCSPKNKRLRGAASLLFRVAPYWELV